MHQKIAPDAEAQKGSVGSRTSLYVSTKSKLSMEDKDMTINIEIDDEEEDLQAFIEEIEADEEMEEDS